MNMRDIWNRVRAAWRSPVDNKVPRTIFIDRSYELVADIKSATTLKDLYTVRRKMYACFREYPTHMMGPLERKIKQRLLRLWDVRFQAWKRDATGGMYAEEKNS